MQDVVAYSCPHCGEPLESLVDPTAGPRQEYVEDCEVCCRPIVLVVTADGTGCPTVIARAES